MPNALRLGMVGTGNFAARHLGVLSAAEPEVAVVGHVGRRLESAEAAAAQFGGAAYPDVDSLLSQGRPDAVIITTPPDTHGEAERKLIEAGIPFLVEKPVGLDLGTIEATAAAITRRGLPVAVGFNWRAADHMPALREVLAAHPPRMIMGRWHGGTPGAQWWRMEARSGGQFVEQAIHILDLATALFGDAELLGAAANRAPHPDYADATVAGAGAALARFCGDVPGVFTTTCLTPGMGGADLTLICDNAQIVVTQKGFTLQGKDGVLHEHSSDPASAYARQDKAFIAAVRSGDPSLLICSYGDALSSHRLALAIRDQTHR